MALERAVFRGKRKKRRRSRKIKKLRRDIEEISISLRNVQRATGCATTTLNKIMKTLDTHLKVEIGQKFNIKNADTPMCQRGGANVLELNGCVHCHDHVFLPSSQNMLCPKCQHPRFNSKFRANEVSDCRFFCCFIFNLPIIMRSRHVGISRFDNNWKKCCPCRYSEKV